MDMIVVALRFIWGIEELRVPIVLLGILFMLGIYVSVWSVYIPNKRLYKAAKNENVVRLSFDSMFCHFRESPHQWIFYESEIYRIKDLKDMTDEEKELFRNALTRFQNGGPYAKKIGTRVILKNAQEGRKYLHFIESKASCPGSY